MSRTQPKKKAGRILYKGSGGIIEKFAEPYLRDRIKGFDKDMNICLTGIPRDDSPKLTHAYFPALMSCCGMLDLLGSLYQGNAKNSELQWVFDYCDQYMPQPDYSADNIILLYEVLRHPTAHMSTGAGIRKPRYGSYKEQRVTWKIYEDDDRPAIRLEPDSDVLDEQSPWDSPHDYRLHIHLKRLQCDIGASVLSKSGYLHELVHRKALMRNFERCMQHIYPVSGDEPDPK